MPAHQNPSVPKWRAPRRLARFFAEAGLAETGRGDRPRCTRDGHRLLCLTRCSHPARPLRPVSVALLQIVLKHGLSAADEDPYLRVQGFEHGFMTLNRDSGKVRPIGPNRSPPEAGIV